MTSRELDTPESSGTPVQTILIVEDDEDIGEFLTEVIEQETPYHSLHVTDALQALEAVRSLIPSLFVLDYRLPTLSGLELADRLRAIERFARVPILMVSANFPPLKALQERGIAFLKKPFDLPLLIKTIHTLVTQHAS